jgi:hypothetical protein
MLAPFTRRGGVADMLAPVTRRGVLQTCWPPSHAGGVLQICSPPSHAGGVLQGEAPALSPHQPYEPPRCLCTGQLATTLLAAALVDGQHVLAAGLGAGSPPAAATASPRRRPLQGGGAMAAHVPARAHRSLPRGGHCCCGAVAAVALRLLCAGVTAVYGMRGLARQSCVMCSHCWQYKPRLPAGPAAVCVP